MGIWFLFDFAIQGYRYAINFGTGGRIAGLLGSLFTSICIGVLLSPWS